MGGFESHFVTKGCRHKLTNDSLFQKEAIILAGGMGTRLRPLINGLPKPMAAVNDEPFLAHALRYWRGQGIAHFIFALGYRAQRFPIQLRIAP